jgi:Domain of unknown function (DUF2760)
MAVVSAGGGRGNALVLAVPAISRLLARDRVIATGRVSSSRIQAFFLALVLGAILASGNVLLAQRFAPELLAFPPIVAWLAGAPIVIGLVLAAALHRPAVAAPAAAAAPPPDDTPALRLLAALQADGRLVDFLLEDIEGYSDDQIGAAVRGIHEPARKALRECIVLEPIIKGRQDEEVAVSEGLDSGAVRLVGNVHGDPPFRGALKHGGWRATATTLPVRRGQDERVIAPAEVEIT